ncbi:glycosyltransferase family 39 protein [Phormidesmis sp. 146-33]
MAPGLDSLLRPQKAPLTPLQTQRIEFVLGLALAIGILLRLLNLSTREFWYDEVLSLLLITGQKIQYAMPPDVAVPLSQYTALLRLPSESSLGAIAKTLQGLLRGLYAGEPHPPLFFLVQHGWLRLFGNGEGAMRSLPALWSVGAIVAAFGLGRTLLGRRGGLLFAALLATNPFYLFHSLNVRMYTPLALWVILSTWALLKLIPQKGQEKQLNNRRWQMILIGSIAAGLMTFYLFAYWVIALAGLVLLVDHRHWWQQGLRLGMGVLLTVPWALWGTLKQLRSADFDRFSTLKAAGNPLLLHVQDVLQTLGIHLFTGDWATALPLGAVQTIGLVGLLILVSICISLWKADDRRVLKVAAVMGMGPLLLALGVDIAAGKFTLGFGWGRALLCILPGCLLLIALGIERSGRWRNWLSTGILLVYLTIDISDLSGRPRQVFHQIADLLKQDPTVPTLVALNSQAWGHVNRLAYYVPDHLSVSLLAQPSATLATALEKTLTLNNSPYQRVLWLESGRPLWSPPTTDTERQQVEKILSDRFQFIQSSDLSGTMNLDRFSLKLYKRASSPLLNP